MYHIYVLSVRPWAEIDKPKELRDVINYKPFLHKPGEIKSINERQAVMSRFSLTHLITLCKYFECIAICFLIYVSYFQHLEYGTT